MPREVGGCIQPTQEDMAAHIQPDVHQHTTAVTRGVPGDSMPQPAARGVPGTVLTAAACGVLGDSAPQQPPVGSQGTARHSSRPWGPRGQYSQQPPVGSQGTGKYWIWSVCLAEWHYLQAPVTTH